MIIGIDGNEANVKERVGVNSYAFELLKSLRKLQGEWSERHSLIVYLKEKPLWDMPEETPNFRYKVLPGKRNWILTRLMPSLIFDFKKPNIFFTPSHYIPPLALVPRVCSIMDLGYLEFSGQFRKKDFWQLSIWSAISIFASKAIIAISNSTKSDIVRHYPSVAGKIHVTHLAYDPSRFNIQVSEKDVRRVKNKYSIAENYVLYLGTLKPSKNIVGLIEAFSKVAGKFPGTKLVIAGKKGWMYEPIYQKAQELGLLERVVFTDFVSEEDKPALIKGARAFTIPSFWEGFGLDALNAMACGTPVVASRVGSLPEVVGEAGILVDPNDTNSIAAGITEVLSASAKKYNNIVDAGLAQVKKFSWDDTARKTLSILEKIK